jgi:hypothetical protein
MRENNGGDCKEPGERGEKRRQPDETEIGSDIQYPKANNCSHSIGDEDLRPAKRQRLTLTDTTLILPDKPVLVANDHYYPLQTSRSPSVIVKSVLFAEYQEWPF